MLGLLVKKLGWQLPESVTPVAWALVLGALWMLAAEWLAGRRAVQMGAVSYTHLDVYKRQDVDIMNLQRAEKLIPAKAEGGLHEVVLANGASLKARTVILSTGARWRQLGVPGEDCLLYTSRCV